jgi:5-methylcytosine-specific restriction endonuclease McrA
VSAETWTDFRGNRWKIVTSHRRLKFKYPGHAALRAHVFYRDEFKCLDCGAQGTNIPPEYDGSECLQTNSFLKDGYRDILILDHILTLKAGGRSVIENLQCLCQTCNRKKIRFDVLDAIDYRRSAGLAA